MSFSKVLDSIADNNCFELIYPEKVFIWELHEVVDIRTKADKIDLYFTNT